MTTPVPDERDIFREIVLGSSIPARMASAMTPAPPTSSVSRRWGVVTAINAVNATVSVDLGAIVIPGVHRVASYAPTVGDTVLLDVVGKDLTVVDTLAPSTKNEYDTRITALSNAQTSATNATNARVAAFEDPPMAILLGSSTATSVSIATGTWTDVPLAAEDTDTHNGHSTSTNTTRYTCQLAGVYACTGVTGWVAGAAASRKGTRIGHTTAGGTRTDESWWQALYYTPLSPGAAMYPVHTVHISMNVGDYVTLGTYQDTGATVSSRADLTMLSVEWRRPL